MNTIINRHTKCGSWQCPRCYITSGLIWSGHPNPDEAPRCCGGEPMIPYAITVEVKSTQEETNQ